jgi:hypothetical protein
MVRVTIPADIATALKERGLAGRETDRFVADILRAYLALPRQGEDAGDLEIINAHAAELNAEAADALSYQVPR